MLIVTLAQIKQTSSTFKFKFSEFCVWFSGSPVDQYQISIGNNDDCDVICDVTNSTPQFIFRQSPCKNRNHVIDLPSKSCQISVQYLPNNSFLTEEKCNIYTVTLSSHHERDPHQCHIVHSGLASPGPAAGGRAAAVRGQNTSGQGEIK